MIRGIRMHRRTVLSSLLALGAAGAGFGPAAAQTGKSALNLAMVAEPPTLDIQSTPADLVCIIMQHVYEPLFTFDAKAALVPMLAEAMPKISADGKLYSITLRKGVMLHSGRELNADDVVASLKRWMEVSPRGKSVAVQVADLSAKGPLGVEISLKNAYAPLLSQLAMASGMAAIMAKESLAQPLREYVGTGPYKFKERKPDQYVLLTRFDGYAARKEAASGYGGKRVAAVEELRFVPVPNANTRVEGALAGQFHYADLLPIEALPRLEKAGGKVVPIMTPSSAFPTWCSIPRKVRLHGSLYARRCRPRWAKARCWRRALATRAFSSPKVTTSPKAPLSIPPPAPQPITNAMPRRPRARPSRPATRASRCVS